MPEITVMMTEMPELMFIEYRDPEIIAWNRLEARPRAHDFTRSLRAEIRDAMFMLTRQRQMLELDAEDTASGIDVRLCTRKLTVDRIALAGASQSYDDTIPM